eukprot:scaffold647174_cov18-Prasinocladus_malaysianus.AAC.1
MRVLESMGGINKNQTISIKSVSRLTLPCRQGHVLLHRQAKVRQLRLLRWLPVSVKHNTIAMDRCVKCCV